MVIDYSHIKSCRKRADIWYSYVLWDGWDTYEIGHLYGPWGPFMSREYRCGVVYDFDSPRELLLCASCAKRNGLLW